MSGADDDDDFMSPAPRNRRVPDNSMMMDDGDLNDDFADFVSPDPSRKRARARRGPGRGGGADDGASRRKKTSAARCPTLVAGAPGGSLLFTYSEARCA